MKLPRLVSVAWARTPDHQMSKVEEMSTVNVLPGHGTGQPGKNEDDSVTAELCEVVVDRSVRSMYR